MISVKEFIETDCANIIDDLREHYGVQRDSKGYKYLKSPFESLDDVLERFENGLNDPWDDLENDGVWDGEESFIKECKEQITIVYNEILECRKKFAEERRIDECM